MNEPRETNRRIRIGVPLFIVVALMASATVASAQALFEVTYSGSDLKEIQESGSLDADELARYVPRGKVKWALDEERKSDLADSLGPARMVFVFVKDGSAKTVVSKPVQLKQGEVLIEMKDSDFIQGDMGLADVLRSFGMRKNQPGEVVAIWGTGGVAQRTKPHVNANLPGVGKLAIPVPELEEGQLGISVITVPLDAKQARRAELRPAMIVIDFPSTG